MIQSNVAMEGTGVYLLRMGVCLSVRDIRHGMVGRKISSLLWVCVCVCVCVRACTPVYVCAVAICVYMCIFVCL